MMGGASLVIVDIDLSSWALLLVIDSLGSFMLLSSAESVSSVAWLLDCSHVWSEDADDRRRYF